jgi:RNA polymerase sigma factor (sigma-70 family)
MEKGEKPLFAMRKEASPLFPFQACCPTTELRCPLAENNRWYARSPGNNKQRPGHPKEGDMPTSPASQLIAHFRRIVLRPSGGRVTDGQLLQRFLDHRDDAAFAGLVQRHAPMVWGVCLRVLGHTQDAEDAFQAAFLVLVRKAASVVPRAAVGNWLYGVAYRTSLKARTARARRRARETQVTEMPEPQPAPPDCWPELQVVLDQELARLPEKYRLPVVLCDLEGRPRQEVARQLAIPEGTLSSRLTTARRMLARRLAQQGPALSGGMLAVVLSHNAASSAPPSLVASTIKAATLLATGQAAAAGAISVGAATLTREVIRAMFVSKLKVATAVLVAALAVAAAATCALSSSGLMAQQPDAERRAAPSPQAADRAPTPAPAAPSRAEQLKTIEAEYRSAYEEVLAAIRAGKVQADKDGGFAEVAAVRRRFAERVRRLIDADPKDEVALDAILFGCRELVADADDPKLYDLLAAHHLSSPKLVQVVGRFQADEPFLRAVIAKTPDADVRGRAILALAALLTRNDRPGEAEPLLERIIGDKDLAKLEHHHGSLAKGAEDLLFEIRHLSVGKVAPEIETVDMDDKPMQLSEYRGKVVLLVFWATWCGPCMAMVPHERDLATRHAGRPFAVVGVNGDGDIIYGPNKEEIDQKAKVKEIIQKKGITWRSFRDYLPKEKVQLSRRWNVDSWPAVYLLDHQGVIRYKFLGDPGEETLDAAVAKLVAAAEADKK